jgi:hypothetical protein
MNRTSVIDKISKLRAQAESEGAMGNENAAMAFGAAVQRLMLEYEVEQHEVDAASAAKDAPEPVIEKEVDLASLGIGRSTKRNAALEDLVNFVGKAHLCKWLLRTRSNWLALVGTPSHVAVAELVIGTMWRSMNKLAAQGLRDAKRDGESIANYTRTFRQAFTHRLAIRYEDEQRAMQNETMKFTKTPDTTEDGFVAAQYDGESTALVVVQREMERVGDYISKNYGKAKARSLRGTGGFNNRAAADGRTAANSVPLRSNAVSGASRGQLSA